MAVAVRSETDRRIALDDLFRLESGRVYLSGVQALVRVIVDQRRADIRAGHNTAAFVSGYPGSPLGGVDRELIAQHRLLDELRIVHVPGLNEELAATAMWGAQIARRFGSEIDGVLTAWYGKNPGLDRASDALRHANWIGTGRLGGGLVMVGDDPLSKSSSIPNPSEMALADFGMPVFYPGNVQDIVRLGRHAIACSRASGLLSGLKIVTNVADATQTVHIGADLVQIPVPVPALPSGPPEPYEAKAAFPKESSQLERSFLDVRLEIAHLYAAPNAVNTVHGDANGWLGIVTAGKPYFDVLQTFADFGIEDPADVGVRIMKLGMIWPIDRDEMRSFARGLEEIVVIEEKRPFIEEHLRAALYGVAHPPLIVGKRDERGEALVPATGEFDNAVLAPALLARLARKVDVSPFQSAADRLARIATRSVTPAPFRTPFFCSGCPHNRSTDVPDPNALVGAGTGCHAMVLFDETGTKGNVETLTQMGGEGVQWIGVAPFLADDQHFVQNMGDGTFHHSGHLAIRFAITAGLHGTFKLFVNDTVAMTGGQDVPGAMAIPEITHALQSEGVTRIIVTTDDRSRYKQASLAKIAELRDRADLLEAQRELAQEPGISVLIHDQQCAAEKRRLRRRGKLAPGPLRVVIDERVCEGCGDCGQKSDCASVRPVATEFGRKTQIHQPSCNQDYSCLDGDCPSFITIRNGVVKAPTLPVPSADLPDPPRASRPARIRMAGIGGTGVVTVSRILGMAALIDGAHSLGLDQTGLAQKGGIVVSDMFISDAETPAPSRAGVGAVSVYLALDLLAATQLRNLAGADPSTTTAILSTTRVPTGSMIIDPDQSFPDLDSLTAMVERFTAGPPACVLDAGELAEALLGDDMQANLITLGAAFQAGTIPLSADAIEEAIRLNGVAVEKSLAAFTWGRTWVSDRETVTSRLARSPDPAPATWVTAALDRAGIEDAELHRILAIRIGDLADFQNRSLALDYLDDVVNVLGTAGPDVAEIVARQLHRLLAYKDEYEVARLHLMAYEASSIRSEFEPGAKFYWNLHPPLLRAMGLKHKVRLGGWFAPAFRLLRASKRLRGTKLDPFGYTRVRRVERALPSEYRELVSSAMELHAPENHATVLELLRTPELIRGYEEIKLDGVDRYRARVSELLNQLHDTPATPLIAPTVVRARS